MVIGGSRLTSRAGHYPHCMARAMVEAMEQQFDWETRHGSFEVKATEVAAAEDGEYDDANHYDDDGDDGDDDDEDDDDDDDDDGDDDDDDDDDDDYDDYDDGGELVEYVPVDSNSDPDLADGDGSEQLKISTSIMQAVKRLHETTGHRSPKRLAHALAIANAPPEVVLAAKRLKCRVCDERRQPKPRRPASLPVPRDLQIRSTLICW